MQTPSKNITKRAQTKKTISIIFAQKLKEKIINSNFEKQTQKKQ